MTEEKKENTHQFVMITHEWLDRWLPILNETELKVYLRLLAALVLFVCLLDH